MCGIIGVISRCEEPNFKQATSTLAHRGPDSSGVFVEEDVHFGHCRLSILDLSDLGSQPMYSLDNRYVIIYNGEVFNHLEIREKLKSKAIPFRSHSDTETVLEGFAVYGEEILPMLNGMFAFSIYDRRDHKLFVARGPIGIKPLYYYWDGKKFAFASEIKALLELDNLNLELFPESFANYLHFLWSPGERTPFRHIKRLLPGHFLKIDGNDPIFTPSIQMFYQIPFCGSYKNIPEASLVDELEAHMLKAVERQLLSDVPVGFFLSGGLDSSLLVAMAKKLHPEQNFQCFTIDTTAMADTEEGFVSDLYYAEKVAQHLDVPLEVVHAYEDYLPYFDRVIWHLDEPQADPAPINVLKICERAREMGYKVLISGAGGDDVFSGYRRHQAIRLDFLFRFIPTWLAQPFQYFLTRLFPSNPISRRISKFLDGVGKNSGARMVHYFSWLSTTKVKKLFASGVLPTDFDPDEALASILSGIPKEKSPLNMILYLEMRSFLPDHNLNYTDKLSMAKGVEVRVPYLDLELVEFSTKIPPFLKLKGNTTKYLLRKVAEKYLPAEVINRPKAGFGAPVRKWIKSDWAPWIRQKLTEGALAQSGLFDTAAVIQLLEDNQNGKIDASYSIWGLLAIESWLNQFVKPKNPEVLNTPKA